MMPARPLGGVIFDLDGTLVDSHLDFEAIRAEMGLPAGRPILEAIAALPATEQPRYQAILDRHELAGAARATLVPGVRPLLEVLAARGIPRGVVTRNSRAATGVTLSRLQLELAPVFCREDAPAKPDPAALLAICAGWRLPSAQVLVVGDYLFDIEAGRRAGCPTLLFTRDRDPAGLPGADLADGFLTSFEDPAALLAWFAM